MAISIPLRAERTRRLSRRQRLLVGVSATAVAFASAIVLSRAEAFHVRGIEVSGASHVRRAHVLEVAGISRETNAFWLDEGAAERRLEAIPWIEDADVRRSFPLGVEIAITERTPIAIARDGIGRVLMAADGTVLGDARGRRNLPMIELMRPVSVEGAGESPVGAARALGAMSPSLRDRVGRVRVLLDGTLEIRISQGPTIRFGVPENASRKTRVIARLLAWARAEGTGIRVLSVIAPSAPAALLVR